MAKTFRIETKVTCSRVYTVEASSPREAENLFNASSKLVHFENDEDINEEIVECSETEGGQ